MRKDPFLAPMDLVGDCVDIVMELAQIARSHPSAKIIALTQEGVTEILDLGKRIEAFNAEHTSTDKGRE